MGLGRQSRMAHNTWAVPVCSYFFAAVETEVKQLDVRARGIMRHHKAHYVQAAPEKLYLPVEEGGRGLRSIELTWEREVASAASYLLASKDKQVQGAVSFLRFLQLVREEGLLHQAEEVRQKYELPENLLPIHCPSSASDAQHKALLAELSRAQKGRLVERLTQKVHHGPHARETRKQGVDKKATYAWVKEGKLTPTTEALVMAAQDDVVMTRDYLFKLPGGSSRDRKCRLCGTYKESLGHLLSKCPVFEHREYTRRHDSVLYLLVKQVATHLGVKVPNCLRAPGGGIKSGVMGSRGSEC